MCRLCHTIQQGTQPAGAEGSQRAIWLIATSARTVSLKCLTNSQIAQHSALMLMQTFKQSAHLGIKGDWMTRAISFIVNAITQAANKAPTVTLRDCHICQKKLRCVMLFPCLMPLALHAIDDPG